MLGVFGGGVDKSLLQPFSGLLKFSSSNIKEVNSFGTFKKNLFMIDLSSYLIGSAFVIS